ncbi:hypothetical protein [Pedobacter jejuensis]|uniref:Uncharacterized protein n=1 Tax=Pedobacter jejuensis TaxID=1268550 RepID=A0A3N0BNS8_9SPHI|nr:hypothetical protein [Pedobacter jejuensis]RNL50550.1 hypothetical protein D7004_16740 [Pedobacter jejuensis]
MKKILIYLFTSLIVISGCRKEDNPKIPVLERVPLIQLTADKTGDATISALNPDAFNGKFSVSLFYPSDAAPSNIDIVVIKNGDATKVKTVQAGVKSFPTSIVLTGTMIKSLFGVSSVLGDSYTIGANVTTTSGKVYPAFSTLGETNNGGISSIAGSTPTISFAAVCQFKMTDYGAIGASVPFTVVTDEWQDYSAGQTIQVKIIDDTHLSFFYGTDVSVQPIVITVNPADNTTSAASVAYGGYGGAPIFTSVSVAGSAANVVAPCDLTVAVRLAHTSPLGSYGSFTIKLKKK